MNTSIIIYFTGEVQQATDGTQSENVSNSEETNTSGQPSDSEKQILKAYFQGQLQRLKLESNSKSIDIAEKKPSDQEIDTAVNTGSLNSEESQAVIDKIKDCYDLLGLTFYAPPVRK